MYKLIMLALYKLFFEFDRMEEIVIMIIVLLKTIDHVIFLLLFKILMKKMSVKIDL